MMTLTARMKLSTQKNKSQTTPLREAHQNPQKRTPLKLVERAQMLGIRS